MLEVQSALEFQLKKCYYPLRKKFSREVESTFEIQHSDSIQFHGIKQSSVYTASGNLPPPPLLIVQKDQMILINKSRNVIKRKIKITTTNDFSVGGKNEGTHIYVQKSAKQL